MKNPMDTHPSLEMHFSNSHDPSLQYSPFWRQSLNQTALIRVLQHVNIKSSSRTQGRKWHRKSESNWATARKDPEWTTRGQSTRTSGSSWDISFSHLSQMATTFNALKFKPTEKMPEQFLLPRKQWCQVLLPSVAKAQEQTEQVGWKYGQTVANCSPPLMEDMGVYLRMGHIIRIAKIRGWGNWYFCVCHTVPPLLLYDNSVFIVRNNNRKSSPKSRPVGLAGLIGHVKNIVSHVIFSGCVWHHPRFIRSSHL